MPKFLIIVFAIAIFLAVFFYIPKYVSVVSSCDGAVVETVNPFDPYACLPTQP